MMIVAGSVVVGKHAISRGMIARIVRANISIIAMSFVTRYANTVSANVTQGASVTVGTSHGIVMVSAFSGSAITTVVRAKISIVAVLQVTRVANSFEAMISYGTLVTVGTGGSVVGMNTFSGMNVTSIVGTRVSVVTALRSTRNAGTVGTSIDGAGISVIARSVIVGENAFAGGNVTLFVRANIIILANFWSTRNTGTICAYIVQSTKISIGARLGVVIVFAETRCGVTVIISTSVTIVAALRGTSYTCSVRAHVA